MRFHLEPCSQTRPIFNITRPVFEAMDQGKSSTACLPGTCRVRPGIATPDTFKVHLAKNGEAHQISDKGPRKKTSRIEDKNKGKGKVDRERSH